MTFSGTTTIRILLSLLLVGIFAPSQADAGLLAKPANNLGLAGYWSFNDGAGTVATDFSGNGYHGSLQNNPSWVNGTRGNALDFATDQFVQVTGLMGSPSVVTVSAWVQLDSVDIDGPDVVSIGDAVTLRLDSEGSVSGIYHFGGFGVTATNMTVAGTGWRHVVYVVDPASTRQEVYIDAVSRASDTDAGAISYAGVGSDTFIGRHGDGGTTRYMNGKIDEVRIYSRALSASEVEQLYRSGVAKVGASTADLQKGTTLESGLVGHWTFDGADFQASILDKTGNGNDGYYIGDATSSAKAVGKLGQAVDIRSTTHVRAGSGAVLDNVAPITACAWVYARSLPSDYPPIIDKTSTGFDGWTIFLNNDGNEGFGFYTNLADGNDYDFSIPRNTWQHVCATWTGAEGGASIGLFLNGVNVTGSSQPYSGGGNSNDSAHNLKFGVSGPYTFDGRIDDVRVYNRILSDAEIRQIYNLGAVVIR